MSFSWKLTFAQCRFPFCCILLFSSYVGHIFNWLIYGSMIYIVEKLLPAEVGHRQRLFLFIRCQHFNVTLAWTKLGQNKVNKFILFLILTIKTVFSILGREKLSSLIMQWLVPRRNRFSSHKSRCLHRPRLGKRWDGWEINFGASLGTRPYSPCLVDWNTMVRLDCNLIVKPKEKLLKTPCYSLKRAFTWKRSSLIRNKMCIKRSSIKFHVFWRVKSSHVNQGKI